jgi:hypothetical protein
LSDTDTTVDAGAISEQAAANVDAWISQDPAKMEWANKPDNGAPDWKPGESRHVADPAKGDDPVFANAETAVVTRAATKLTELGAEGAALVQEWGGHTSPNFQENLSYAKAAFADIAKNRPDLIAKVDASGLGNDPAVLKILSELGRQKAHTYGDNTVSSRRSSYDEPSRPLPSGNSAAQRELDRIYKETPPGSEGYRTRAVQDRVLQLNETIHGTEPAVGLGGRTA